MIIDIDKFKMVNNIYGHDAGDKVIRGIGEVLLEVWKVYNAEPSRYGGDEFCIICEDEPTEFIEAIREEIAKIYVADGFTVTISLGMYRYEGGNMTSADLLHMADELMYEEKKKSSH